MIQVFLKNHMEDDGVYIEKEYQKREQKSKEPKKKEKKEKKEKKKSEKSDQEKKPNGYTKEIPVDSVLADFLGTSSCSRTNVFDQLNKNKVQFVKVMWKYIKEHVKRIIERIIYRIYRIL